MKEISPFVIALEMFKKNISSVNSYKLKKKDVELIIDNLGDIDRIKSFNSIIMANTDGYETILFGWNKSDNCVVLFLNEAEKFIRIYKQRHEYLDNFVAQLYMKNLKEDDIHQLTLEYGISKVELSDELYEFIFGE